LLRREPFLTFQLTATYIFYIAFLIVPLVYVLSAASQADITSLAINPKYFSPYVAQEPIVQYTRPDGRVIYIIRGFNYGLILNSILIASIVTIISIALGLFFAVIISRYIFPMEESSETAAIYTNAPSTFYKCLCRFQALRPYLRVYTMVYD
jgi:iron(III) transport system permease protein